MLASLSHWVVQCPQKQHHKVIFDIQGQLTVKWYMAWHKVQRVLGRRYVARCLQIIRNLPWELAAALVCSSLLSPPFPQGLCAPLLWCLGLSILNMLYWLQALLGGYCNVASVLFCAFLSLTPTGCSVLYLDCSLLVLLLFVCTPRQCCLYSCQLVTSLLMNGPSFDERCLFSPLALYANLMTGSVALEQNTNHWCK